jgi:hypothetical protein
MPLCTRRGAGRPELVSAPEFAEWEAAWELQVANPIADDVTVDARR